MTGLSPLHLCGQFLLFFSLCLFLSLVIIFSLEHSLLRSSSLSSYLTIRVYLARVSLSSLFSSPLSSLSRFFSLLGFQFGVGKMISFDRNRPNRTADEWVGWPSVSRLANPVRGGFWHGRFGFNSTFLVGSVWLLNRAHPWNPQFIVDFKIFWISLF